MVSLYMPIVKFILALKLDFLNRNLVTCLPSSMASFCVPVVKI